MTATARFLAARDLLLSTRGDPERAVAEFRWPDLPEFNWALDYFDVMARGNQATALRIVHEGSATEAPTTSAFSFAALADRSDRLASGLRRLGVKRGDRLLIMLPNHPALWQVLLAALKIGAVVVPATTQLTAADIADRLARGGIRHAVTESACTERFAGAALGVRLTVGARVSGWTDFDDALSSAPFQPEGVTRGDDPLLLYFTSGTTARPKLVEHTHVSYPVGHLSTMYWIGIRPGSLHQNISAPGWAKHAWSSVFAPWNAGAAILMHDSQRFVAQRTLELLRAEQVASLCAPPTVWRMLILEDLGARPEALREVVGAGEPLNPEILERVQRAWNLTLRDGFGQTETTCVIGNSPGLPVKPGAMGKPLPGYRVALLDAEGREAEEGEVALKLAPPPLGLMRGYADDPARTAEAMAGGYYRTGDEASRDSEGYYLYVGRGDDVFKSSDYRISPFELESVLIEHPAVAEAAVVPSPDPVRLSVPKAFVALAPGHAPSAALAREILGFVRAKVAPYKRIARLEFAELPKTISGKIRRVQLRTQERERHAKAERGAHEHWWDELGD